MTHFGSHLRSLRTSRGLTLRQLARECGQSDARLCHIEQGKDNVTLSTLYTIAKALDMKPGQLLNPELQEP